MLRSWVWKYVAKACGAKGATWMQPQRQESENELQLRLLGTPEFNLTQDIAPITAGHNLAPCTQVPAWRHTMSHTSYF